MSLVCFDCRTTAYLTFGLILPAALVLRTYRLGNPVVYSDEAFSWRVASCALPDLIQRVCADTAPLGHFLVLKGWLTTVGASPVQMRSLSVIFGLATVLMVYRLCTDAVSMRLKPQNRADANCPFAVNFGPLFAATLVAIHASQISASRIARMYSQGCFLAAASSWCLLKALYAPRYQGAWWTAYTVLAAVALHTHNFALFMVAAQFLYIALVLCRVLPTNTPIDRRKTLWLTAIAFLVLALLYAPWLPIFLQQAVRVKQNFWLPEISAGLLAETFATWLTGIRGGALTWFAAVWLAFFMMMTVYTIIQRDGLALFFLLQALVPWIATILISSLGGRPLLDERYLVFSEVALFTYWGYTCSQLPTTIALVSAVNLSIPTAVGTYEFVAAMPAQPPSIIRAVEVMQTAYQPRDVIIAPEARDLNIFKYYASQAGWRDFDIRCPSVEHKSGHVNHISSLSPTEWLRNHALPRDVRRVWTINNPNWVRTPDWAQIWSALYDPMDRTWDGGLQTSLFERRDKSE